MTTVLYPVHCWICNDTIVHWRMRAAGWVKFGRFAICRGCERRVDGIAQLIARGTG